MSMIEDIKRDREAGEGWFWTKRRIARVPEIEDALIAAGALAKAAALMGEGRHHHEVKVASLPDVQVMVDKPVFDAVLEALAAYRAATGAA